MRLEYNLRMIKEKTMSAFQLQAWIKVGGLYLLIFFFNIENNIFGRIIQIILAIITVIG